jgi:hypothetical protein
MNVTSMIERRFKTGTGSDEKRETGQTKTGNEPDEAKFLMKSYNEQQLMYTPRVFKKPSQEDGES